MKKNAFKSFGSKKTWIAVSLVIITAFWPTVSAAHADHGDMSTSEDDNYPQALKPGDAAPLFMLPDASGNLVKLEDLLQRGPVIVAFYRGLWCPYCNLALIQLQRILPEIKALGATLVAISPQNADYTADTVEMRKLEYFVLSDVGLAVARRFGLPFDLTEKTIESLRGMGVDLPERNDHDKWELPVPGYFIISRDGIIRWTFARMDYTKRPKPSELLTALRRVVEGERTAR